MTSAAVALTSLEMLRMMRRAAEELPAVRLENAQLTSQLQELKAQHANAVADLARKGRRLEDLLRQVIAERNRMAAELTDIRLKASRIATVRAATTQTEGNDRGDVLEPIAPASSAGAGTESGGFRQALASSNPKMTPGKPHAGSSPSSPSPPRSPREAVRQKRIPTAGGRGRERRSTPPMRTGDLMPAERESSSWVHAPDEADHENMQQPQAVPDRYQPSSGCADHRDSPHLLSPAAAEQRVEVMLLSPDEPKPHPPVIPSRSCWDRRMLPAARITSARAQQPFSSTGSPRAVLLLIHLASAACDRTSNNVRSDGSGGELSAVRIKFHCEADRMYVGLNQSDGLVSWRRVPAGCEYTAAIGLTESGVELAWCAALSLVLDSNITSTTYNISSGCEKGTLALPNLRSCSVRDLVPLCLLDRLHGPFPLRDLSMAAVAQRMDVMGDMLILSGVEGEAIVTCWSMLGKSRVFLVARVVDASNSLDRHPIAAAGFGGLLSPSARESGQRDPAVRRPCASQQLHADGPLSSEVVSQWITVDDLTSRFHTVTIVEQWPVPRQVASQRSGPSPFVGFSSERNANPSAPSPPSLCVIEARVPVVFSGGRCEMLLLVVDDDCAGSTPDSSHGGVEPTAPGQPVMHLDVSLLATGVMAHLCSLHLESGMPVTRLQGPRRWARGIVYSVHCETVLDCDACALLIIADADAGTKRPMCPALVLGTAGTAFTADSDEHTNDLSGLGGELVFVPTARMVQIDGRECFTDELFASSMSFRGTYDHAALAAGSGRTNFSPATTESYSQTSDGAAMPLVCALEGRSSRDDDERQLQEQQEMVATVRRLALEIDVIELKATSKCLDLFEGSAGTVCEHFSNCSELFAISAAMLDLQARVAANYRWMADATAVIADHIFNGFLPVLMTCASATTALNYAASARWLQWVGDAGDTFLWHAAMGKGSLWLDAVPLGGSSLHADECFPAVGDFLSHCGRWQAAREEAVWQRAVTVASAAVDGMAANIFSSHRALARQPSNTAGKVNLHLQSQWATATERCDASSNTDGAAPLAAQLCCDSVTSVAMTAMYKEPFLQLLRLRNCLEQRCLALELAVGTREAELRSLEAHSAGLAMANDAIAAELSTRDVELDELCLRCQASQDAADQLRRELVEARTSLTKSLMAHQAASEHGSMQLAQKDRSIAVLDAEVLSLRMQLEAMRPALLSLTAPQSERGSTAGSVRPASGSTAKRTAKK